MNDYIAIGYAAKADGSGAKILAHDADADKVVAAVNKALDDPKSPLEVGGAFRIRLGQRAFFRRSVVKEEPRAEVLSPQEKAALAAAAAETEPSEPSEPSEPPAE